MLNSTTRHTALTVATLVLFAQPAFAAEEEAAVEEAVSVEETPVVEESPAMEVAPAVEQSPAPTDGLDFVTTPISMDRSGWPTIVIGPEDGRVTHNPTFMGDVPLGEDIVSPLHAPDPVWQIEEALRGADAGKWNGENLADLGAQPFIGLAQFVALPFRAVIENPWSKTTSPK